MEYTFLTTEELLTSTPLYLYQKLMLLVPVELNLKDACTKYVTANGK